MLGPIANDVFSKMMNVEIENSSSEAFASEFPNLFLANLVNFFQSFLHDNFCTMFADSQFHSIPLLTAEQYDQHAGIRSCHTLRTASNPSLLLAIWGNSIQLIAVIRPDTVYYALTSMGVHYSSSTSSIDLIFSNVDLVSTALQLQLKSSFVSDNPDVPVKGFVVSHGFIQHLRPWFKFAIRNNQRSFWRRTT